jgi:TonB-linked SusC/RagA family outer membrane protein
MEKKFLILSLCLSLILAFTLPVYAQQLQTRTIIGTIVDEKGEPIIGATVRVLNTTSGTVTDVDGHFKLVAPVKGRLSVSYVGYITQIVSDLNDPRIVLKEDLKSLDEVVVVGYGAQKMKNVTGSVATVAANDVGDLSVSNMSAALSGLASGLSVSGGSARPGDAASLVVRQADVMGSLSGTSTYTPDPSPLYVIDDYICQDATLFNNLDASMIESVTVLKDASAAVYGSRAANGVILVKTKRGKSGLPKITYSAQFGDNDAVATPKMLSAYNYGVIWNGTQGNAPTAAYDHKATLFQADELAAMQGLNYNTLSEYWKPAVSQKHALNISGGTDNTTYFAGMSYFSQNGNLGWVDYNRWNYRAGVDTKIRKWLKASLTVSGDYGNTDQGYNKIGSSAENVDYYTLLTHPRYIPDQINGNYMMTYGPSNKLIDDLQYYNYGAIQNLDNYSHTTPQNMNIAASAEYDFGWSDILKGLKMKFTYNKHFYSSKTDILSTYVPVYQLITRGGSGNHLYSGVSGVDYSSGNFAVIEANNGDQVSRSTTNNDDSQMNFYTTYTHKFGQHEISALFTIEREQSESENLDGYVLDPLTFTNGQSASATGTQTTDFSRSEAGMLSYVGRFNYSYQDRYLAEFLIRSDASTKFAPQNYWGTFPCLSLGWIMSEEDWFKKHVNWIDYLKLRGSFGITGKDNIAAWAWLQTYSTNSTQNKGAVFGTNPSTQIDASIMSSAAPNVNAHWDTEYNSNLGADAHFLKDRLSVNLDGYYTMGRNLFMPRTGATFFPSTVGTQPAAENFGSIDSYGIELVLGWKDKITRDLHYNVRVTTGWSDNKLLKKYWPSLLAISDQHPGKRTDTGVWGYDCMGMFTSYQEINEYVAKYHITNYLGLSPSQIRPGMLIYRDVRGNENSDGTYQGADGVINSNDMVQISKHSSNPYGFTTNFGLDWKGLSINAQLNANWGSYTMIPSSARTGTNSTYSSTSTYSALEYTNLPSFWANNMFVYNNVTDANGNIVAAQNLNGKYPNLQYTSINGLTSTFWAVNAATVSLRTITVAYSLPADIVKKLQMESCRFNLTCQNVCSLINPYPDHFMDPLGGTYGNYPTLRTITLGVNVSF